MHVVTLRAPGAGPGTPTALASKDVPLSALQFRMLGPLEVLRDGAPVDLGSPKQRAVLAILLLDLGRVVSTDRIVESVWGDDAPNSVSASLQAYISNLRRILRTDDGRSLIERRTPGYVLDIPADQVDRTAFLEAARATRAAVEDRDWDAAITAGSSAVGMWRGPLLADVGDARWVASEWRADSERLCETSEQLITALLGADRTGEAVAEAERLLAVEPLRERGAWLHMAALYRAGRSVEALDYFRAQSARLDDELGLEPPQAFRDLHAAVLRQDPALATWPNPPRVASRTTAAVPQQRIAAPHAPGPVTASAGFVGRARELAAISELFGGDQAGVRWLVITGPAGIGKTRMAEETVASLARRDVRVVRTTCPDDEGSPPWWPVRQLVRSFGADPDAVLTPPATSSADEGRYIVYERLEQLLQTAVAPLAVLVDDAQWADRNSLRWLSHIADGLAQASVSFLLTVRDEVESPALERLLASVARSRASRMIAMPPLEAAEVGALAAQVSGEFVGPSEAVALARQTAGNPFFVGEYARLPAEERAAGGVPMAVRPVLRRRLAAVDSEVLQVLRTAALAGDPIDVDLLRAVTRLDDDELADLLEEAADAELIVPLPDGTAYRFAHGLLRDEVLAGLSVPRRQRLHARIAEALGSGTGQDRLVARARHLVAALPLADAEAAFEACRAAATDAESRWQSDAAAEWWAAALRVYGVLPAERQHDEERDDLLIARINALGRAGYRQTVITDIEAALLDAVRNDRIGSAGRLAAATLRTSGSWPWTSFSVDAGPLLTRLAGVEPLVRVDPGAHARVLAALAVGSYYDPDAGVADRLSARSLEIAEALGDADVLADAIWGRALSLNGVAPRVDETVVLAQRLLALPHRLLSLDAVLAHNLLTLGLLTRGEVRAAEEHLRDGIAGSDAMRLPVSRVQLRWLEATLATWHGDLERAEQLARLAAELHRQTELYIMNVDGFSSLARFWERGDFAAMAAMNPVDNPTMPFLQAVRQIVSGDADAGVATLEQARAHPPREVWTTLGERVLAAHVVADAGVLPAVAIMREVLEPFRPLMGTLGQTAQLGPVSLALARLEMLAGEPDRARVSLAAARRMVEEGDGRAMLLRCRMLAARLDGADADELADLAAAAEAMGLARIAAHARRLLVEAA